jgi:uncharacterized protein YkwD
MYLCAALLLTAALGAGADDLNATQQAQSDVHAAQLEIGCNNCGKAVCLLQTARDLVPGWIVPHQYLALAYQKQSDEDKAVAEYTVVEKEKYDNLPSGRANPTDKKDAILQAEATSLWLINKTRMDNSLPPLRPDASLAVIAREHSLEMRDLGYFQHYSPTPALQTPMDRFRAYFTYLPRCIAENIARCWGSVPAFSLDRVIHTHQDFLNSPGHRANILLDEVTNAGIGIALDAQGSYWLTEDFAKYTTQD